MKKILLVSFILCNIYGFSAKVSVQRSSTLKSENKDGKNIGEMTIKDTIKEISENDRKRFEEIDLEKKEKKEGVQSWNRRIDTCQMNQYH